MKLEAFYKFITPEAMGCPDMVIDRAVLDAARDFCRRTDAWRVTSTASLIADKTKYEVQVPDKADVVRILNVKVNGDYLRSAGEVFNHNPFSESWGSASSGYRFSHSTDWPNLVELIEAPKEYVKKGIEIDASVTPQFDANEIDDALFQKWYEPIVMKAKHLLFIQPGTSWANGELGSYYFQLYSKAVAQSESQGRKEYTSKDTGNPVINSIW
jgi:glucosamine 6-phosphate synthetase-like amidotransferase/phosphosugar isomerase protein